MTHAQTSFDRTAQCLVLADGQRVGFAVYGDPDGLPVLALHGAPACRLMFAIADAPARRLGLKLIAPDRPGYGLTPIDAAPALAKRATWLAEFADSLGIDRFGILGISGGAPYSVALAARLGSRITGLALVSPMGPVADYAATAQSVRDPVPFWQRRFFLHLAKRTWLTVPFGSLGGRLFCFSPGTFSGWVPRLAGAADAAILSQTYVRERMIPMTVEAFRQGARGATTDLEIFSQPWGIDYAKISAPSIMWQGTSDTVVPAVAAYHLASLLANCRLNRIDGAGHFWVFNHIDAVLNEAWGVLSGRTGSV